MATQEELQQSISALLPLTAAFNADTDEGSLHTLSLSLAKLDDQLREGIQLETAEQIGAIIGKLNADDAISSKELELIRLWMLSDAEFYLQMENDVENWIAELERLFGQIRSSAGRNLSTQAMGQLSGSVRDALRVISDMEFLREQQQRVQRFEAATQTLTTEDKGHLARLLLQKLRSPDE